MADDAAGGVPIWLGGCSVQAEHEQAWMRIACDSPRKREENSGISWPSLVCHTMIKRILKGFAASRTRSNSLWETIEDKEKTIIVGLSGNG